MRQVLIWDTHTGEAVCDLTADIEKLYTLVINSMDWGSGFLETEDVAVVRNVMEKCGFKFEPNGLDECVNCTHCRDHHYSHNNKECVHDSYKERGGPLIRPCNCNGFKARWDIEAMTDAGS